MQSPHFITGVVVRPNDLYDGWKLAHLKLKGQGPDDDFYENCTFWNNVHHVGIHFAYVHAIQLLEIKPPTLYVVFYDYRRGYPDHSLTHFLS